MKKYPYWLEKMKVGILSDAHGNWRALEKCLLAMQRIEVDVVYFLGDAVGYLPGEMEVMALLDGFKVRCQKGNHEGLLLGELPLSKEKDRIYGLSQARKRFSREDLQILQQWPETQEFSCDGKNIYLVHGSPTDILQGYVHPHTDFSFMFRYPYDAIFMGHTHSPFVLKQGDKLIANVGSCGLPRDQGDMAAFAVYDTQEHCAEIFRVQFDWGEVVEELEQGSIAPEVVECFKRSAASIWGKVVE
jgi:putative phosphoesterase